MDAKMRNRVQLLINDNIDDQFIMKMTGINLQDILIAFRQQEKYAELGRLAVKVNICNELFNYGSTNCLTHGCCKNEYDFCQKRSELLAEVSHER
ncbi:hypothetical protein PIPA1_32140 [Pelosinus sp. IPA-1]|nr:hypothetical protein PIPA1_32140 [Pelosinus sp. IPA-1]